MISDYLGKEEVFPLCVTWLCPLGHPLRAVSPHLQGWECALSLLGNSCACSGTALCSQILTRQVLVAEEKKGKGGMVCPKEES